MKSAKVKVMPFCPKCSNEVNEEMDFCPKCGASLKGEPPWDLEKWGKEFGERMAKRGREIGERMSEGAKGAEMDEKYEKDGQYEKAEVQEKREFAFIGPLIGGLILIFLGLMFYLQVTGSLNIELVGASFFIVIGGIIIAAGIFAVTMARRRHPQP